MIHFLKFFFLCLLHFGLTGVKFAETKAGIKSWMGFFPQLEVISGLFLSTWSSLSSRNGPNRHALPHGLPALRLHGLHHQQHRTHPAAAHHPRLCFGDILHTVRYSYCSGCCLKVHSESWSCSQFVQTSFLCTDTRFANNQKLTGHKFYSLSEQVVTPGLFCHALFPYFPITLLCVVVIAKQPGRQTSVHSCRRICGRKVCAEQTQFRRMQNVSCSVYSRQKWSQVSAIQLPGQMHLLWGMCFGPRLLSRLFSPRFKLQALKFGWWRLKTRPVIHLKAAGVALYHRFKKGWGVTVWPSRLQTVYCLVVAERFSFTLCSDTNSLEQSFLLIVLEKQDVFVQVQVDYVTATLQKQ